MSGSDMKALVRAAACLVILAAGTVGTALGQPVTLRLGYGTAAEEQLWLTVAKPEIGRNYGKAYKLEGTRFTGSDKRAQAYEAGAIDLASRSANGVIFARRRRRHGQDDRVVHARKSRAASARLSMSRRTRRSNRWRTSRARPSASTAFATSGHLWLKTALEKVGLPESDVTIVPISFSAMAGVAESGKIDVGQFPQPFAALVEKQVKVAQDLRRQGRQCRSRRGTDRDHREGRIPQDRMLPRCAPSLRISGRDPILSREAA